MNSKPARNIILVFFILTLLGIVFLVIFPISAGPDNTTQFPQGRVIIPQALQYYPDDVNPAEYLARMELSTLRLPLEDGEIYAALINQDFDNDLYDEQIVAYRNLFESGNPIYISYIDYDALAREYVRVWSAPVAATQPGTISLYTLDLLGDRSTCMLVSGMNNNGYHTLTIYRHNVQYRTGREDIPPFSLIGEMIVDGSIMVRETERSQAYQLGMASGQSFSIVANVRNQDSANLMDQIEITYDFNSISGVYEQSGIVHIHGTQVEQQRVRELLRDQRTFEEFISGLWYYVSPQGTIDSRQYIYFDPPNKEIIFYENETQQVFTWDNAFSTRIGLFIRSQNLSVATFRRSIDIELESLDSIRIKISDNVRFVLGSPAPWDGSYRKARAQENITPQSALVSHISAAYDSPIGTVNFDLEGNFRIISAENNIQGKYAFYLLNEEQILELRPLENRDAGIMNNTGPRETYLVEFGTPETGDIMETITLSRVRLSTRGIQRLYERAITLTLKDIP